MAYCNLTCSAPRGELGHWVYGANEDLENRVLACKYCKTPVFLAHRKGSHYPILSALAAVFIPIPSSATPSQLAALGTILNGH